MGSSPDMDDKDDTPGKARHHPWRRRLRFEPWRHSAAILIAAVLASTLTAALFLMGELRPTPPGDFLDLGVMAPAVLSVFAFYGPVYLLLSNAAWRGVSGDQFRVELQRSAPPAKGLIRDLLVGTPTQMSITAAVLSLGAVYFVAIRPGTSVAVLLISLACVCGSWILVLASFSVDYAREWASSDGFTFPGEDELSYSDFVYLAAQASTTYSSSDVSTANRRARRLVTIHAITSFVFATVIWALLVALVLNAIAD